MLIGIHPVREALRAGRAMDRVLVAKGAGGPRIQEIVDLCRTAKIPVRFEPRSALDTAAAGQPHQGIVAYGAATRARSLDELPDDARLLVLLDGVEDPHNLGAIVRTANAAGAGAVLIPERRAAGLTDTVAKAAAGALEYVPVVRVVNVSRSLEDLKARGYWIYGLDERRDRGLRPGGVQHANGVRARRRRQGGSPARAPALRRAGADPDVRRDSFAERLRCRRSGVVRVEAAPAGSVSPFHPERGTVFPGHSETEAFIKPAGGIPRIHVKHDFQAALLRLAQLPREHGRSDAAVPELRQQSEIDELQKTGFRLPTGKVTPRLIVGQNDVGSKQRVIPLPVG